MNILAFKNKPIMGIMRGIKADVVTPLTEAVIAAGLETVEITMNTEDAPGLIRSMAKCAKGRLTIGAGTVLTMDELKKALDSGATFIVQPVLIREIVDNCVKHKVPVFPGALTPQEIYDAWQAGATMVKVFPAKFFGPEYFKEIKGPLNKIELLACAGVTPENMKDYFNNGASAVSFGASVFKNEWLASKDFNSIANRVKDFMRALPR
jgi:2-dehydro-3-deoxyphosphogluconate aldolase / (4S)-4-hydroxy-2-oxoglutarate aldolase